VDSVVWIQPKLIERMARDLMGNLVTKASDAFPDEWHEDFSESDLQKRRAAEAQSPSPDTPAGKQR
jgi:hypothetical protein